MARDLLDKPFHAEWMSGIVAMTLATVGLCYALTHRQIFLYRHQRLMLAMAKAKAKVKLTCTL